MAVKQASRGFLYYMKGDTQPLRFDGDSPISAMAELLNTGQLASLFVEVDGDWVQLQVDARFMPPVPRPWISSRD